MLIAKNSSGWRFVWPAESDFVEVYNDKATYPEIPVDAIYIGDLRRNHTELRKFANEASDYGKVYNA